MVLGFVLMCSARAIAVGPINGTLVRFGGFTPVAATLATYIALQGVSLLLRARAGRLHRHRRRPTRSRRRRPVPVASSSPSSSRVVLECVLRRTRWGLRPARGRLATRRPRTGVGVKVAARSSCAYVAVLALRPSSAACC